MLDPALQLDIAQIPDKLYFRIGEVSSILGVEPHVLRFWEGEFPSLAPKKSGTGQRLYKRKEVELLLQIKHLLYEKRYTIAGARQMLLVVSKKARTKVTSHQRDLFAEDPLPGIRRELAEILKILS